MSQSILTLKDELAGMLHGTNIDDVHYSLGVFYRASRQLLLDVRPFETQRTAQLTTPLYEDIFNYAVPDDLSLNNIIDIRPQVNRTSSNGNDQRFIEQFDQYKENDTFSVEYVNDVKTLRIAKQLNSPVRFGDFSSVSGWSVGDDATNLTLDNQYFTYGTKSLNFDLDGSTTDGYIENSTIALTDLSTHENVSRLFLDVYFPDSSIVTSVTLRWGNDSSNYFSATATSPFSADSFQNGWNTIGFNWNGASETGTVDSSAIDYVRITITYDGTAETDIRVDNLRSILGSIYEVVYYSDYMFEDATTGARKLQPTNDDDLVILEPATMNVYLMKVAEMAAQQAQQQGSSVDIQYFANEYQRARKRYVSLYPTQRIRPKSTYYRMRGTPNQRVTRIIK